jgi:hypothetical protein
MHTRSRSFSKKAACPTASSPWTSVPVINSNRSFLRYPRTIASRRSLTATPRAVECRFRCSNQGLSEKTHRFLPPDLRARGEVTEWLFWQTSGLGPMAGQNHHFSRYAPQKISIRDRPLREGDQPALRRVLNRRPSGREFIAGDYSIADMASYPWVVPYSRQGQNLDEFLTSSGGSTQSVRDQLSNVPTH